MLCYKQKKNEHCCLVFFPCSIWSTSSPVRFQSGIFYGEKDIGNLKFESKQGKNFL
uniref:Uncharacterized protein n=1 Tax=Arundo donax TaxID=35708 RepID=A0A0A9EY56_ARUDO